MKVLFAVSDDEISEAIVKEYKEKYKEIITYKNVYYFNAIIKEIQRDQTYDRIVISEELEPFTSTNFETIDKFMFEKLDNISDEITRSTSIILICVDRRSKGEPLLSKIFGIGLYNALMGNDRSITQVCNLLRTPRSKKEAKTYYGLGNEEIEYQRETENSVKEDEIQNILAHYRRLGKSEEKYVETFNNIAAQYNDTQLRLIIKYLPLNVKAVLEVESEKYQSVMSFSESAYQKQKKKNEDMKKNSLKVGFIDSNDGKNRISSPVVIPSEMNKEGVRKLGKKKIENQEEKIEKKPIIKSGEKQLSKIDLEKNKRTEEKVKKLDDKEVLEEIKTEDTPKRGRGRPRKNPLPEVIDKPKRGRGRPRKNPLPEEKLVEETEEDDDILKVVNENDELLKSINKVADIEEDDDDLLPDFEDEEEYEDDDDSLLDLEDEEEYEDDDDSLLDLEDEEEYEDDDDSLLDLEDEEEYEDDDDSLLDLEDEEEYEDDDDSLLDLEDEEEYEDDDDSLLDLEDEEEYEDDDDSLLDLEDEEDDDLLLDSDEEEYEDDDDSLLDLEDEEDDDLLLDSDEEEYEDNDDLLLDSDDEEYENDDLLVNKNNTENEVTTRVNSIMQQEVSANKPKVSDLSRILTPDKKIAAFVGTSKNGTSFLVNNLALVLSEMGVKTAILDLTKNKNSYYIFTKNEENLRKIAYTSFDKLKNGIAQGISVNRNLTVYTALPGEQQDIQDVNSIISTLVNNHNVILIDSDFETPYSYFEVAQEIYLVQSMDILTIQPLTYFLKELKNIDVDLDKKARIIINKEQKVRNLSKNAIIGGISSYNDPSMSYMTKLFDKERIINYSMPLDIDAGAKYLEALVTCELSLAGYSRGFIENLKRIATEIVPAQKGGALKQSYFSNNKFSTDMNSTLEHMKRKY